MLRNVRGEVVDPVPFIVVSGLWFMLCLSFGPLYGQAYGLSTAASVAVSAVAFLVTVPPIYYLFVWHARSKGQQVPPAFRIDQVLYLAVLLGLLIVALTLPLL